MEKDEGKVFYKNIEAAPVTGQIKEYPIPYHAAVPSMICEMKPLLGPENTNTICHFCNALIKTSVIYTTTTRTHTAAALCGLIFCCLCCYIYSTNSAKNTDHYCPNCERYLGTYEK